MAVSATCTGAFTTETGRYYVTISGMGQLEFQNLAELESYGAEADAPSQMETAAKFLIKIWLSQNPDGQNLSALVNKKLTLDLTALPAAVFVQQVG